MISGSFIKISGSYTRMYVASRSCFLPLPEPKSLVRNWAPHFPCVKIYAPYKEEKAPNALLLYKMTSHVTEHLIVSVNDHLWSDKRKTVRVIDYKPWTFEPLEKYRWLCPLEAAQCCDLTWSHGRQSHCVCASFYPWMHMQVVLMTQ